MLRKQMGSFKDEINFDTGQFVTPKKGLIATLDGIKIQSLNSDTNPYSNPHHTWHCSPGWSSNQPDGECRAWGDPIGEMMFETLRYFGGAGSPEPEYTYTNSGSDDQILGLPEVSQWKDPYTEAPTGGGFLECAKPFETVISDVNPSYDSELPGNAFGASAPSGALPTKLQSLDVAAEGQAIWNNEGYGTRQVYIGQSGNLFDAAPTAKTATSFGNIRGLSPEEPTKQGTYYSASVAYFGHNNDLSESPTDQKLHTFSVALSSPLPRIEFPINGHDITLVPFAKSIAGCIGVSPSDAFIPTNQIVGFYVEKIVNVPGQPTDPTINGGRPYAKFRISYEDAEQGNDYDMDAIVSYELSANADNTLSVSLNSEYAAGCAIQHIGYVISGSDADGVYLEVRDKDTGASADPRFRLDTPDGFSAGQCSIPGSNNPNTSCPTDPSLPLTHARVFGVGTTAPATVLKDPLWFAAKYGGFKDENGNGVPDEGEWDKDVTGTPDNYFLVTNALGLKDQLKKAFDAIIAESTPTASVATSTARYLPGATLAYQATFNATDWTGDLKAFKVGPDGVYVSDTPVWSANDRLVDAASRKIFTSTPQTGSFNGLGVPFTSAGLTTAMQSALVNGLDPDVYNFDDVLAYLRGDQSNEADQTPPGPYRTRSSRIGDILNSSPAVSYVLSYGYAQLLADVAPIAAGSYAAFVESKKAVYGGEDSASPVVFFGANDGMLHAINGSNSNEGGKEWFAYVPNAAIDTLDELVKPSYQHHYYVDGTPTIGDAYLGAWKTVLAASTGAGSRSVFALDVTNPSTFSASDVLWEFNSKSADAEAPLLGLAMARPWIGLADDGNWVATFGNGYDSDGAGSVPANSAVLFIRDLATGAKVATIPIPVADQCGSGESGCTGRANGLAGTVLVDNDASGAGDTIYAGDYLGNLW
ncbi:MAG: PilC/PilY family type IV pilus protein, partial [Rhodanobacteraceae bacterium]